MSRKLRVLCDRCGCEVEKVRREIPITPELAQELGLTEVTMMDLCEGCTRGLVQFFKALHVARHRCLPGAIYVNGQKPEDCEACAAIKSAPE